MDDFKLPKGSSDDPRLARVRGQFWMNEALELHRKAEQQEKAGERRFTSNDLRSRLLGKGLGGGPSLPGLAEALELDRKMRRGGR